MFIISKSQPSVNLIFFFHIFVTRYISAHNSGLFDVRTNLISVEKLTFDYLKNTNYWSNPLKILLPQPKSIPSVCDLSHESKLTLCWSYLKSEEYKFEFTLKIQNDSLNTKCEYRKLSMRILDQRQLHRDELLMFRCPQIAEDFFLKEAPIFYVSDSGWKSVAIIFKQKNYREAIHPHKYIREIDFDELKLRTDVFIEYKLPSSVKKSLWYRDVEKKQLITIDSKDYKFDLFQRSIDAIQISNPYDKFRAFFRATDVCGLDIGQKIYICREILADFDVDGEDLYVDEYSDGRCTRIIVESFGTRPVSAVQCPPEMIYDRNDESSDLWETMYKTSLHFLTKTVIKARFIAIESSKKTWKIHFQAAGINFQFLQEVRHIERNSLYAQHSGAHESSSMSSYQGREKSYQFTFLIETNRKTAENSVLELSRMKKLNSPYEKFRVTFSIQNVCHLRLEQKLGLCQKIFENQVFGYKMAKVNELKCNKKKVFLITTRITVPIRDFALMVLSCPLTQSWPPFKLHVSGSPETNSVLILDQSLDENEVTARTIIRGYRYLANELQTRESVNQFHFLKK